MYRLEKEQYGKKQVEEIIETKEGSLSRLLSINDHSLTAKQQEEEDQRVQELMTSQSAKRKLQRVLDAETRGEPCRAPSGHLLAREIPRLFVGGCLLELQEAHAAHSGANLSVIIAAGLGGSS